MSEETPLTAAIIRGGPAGLMAADVLARGGVAVTIYERCPLSDANFCWPDAGASTSPITRRWRRFCRATEKPRRICAAAIECPGGFAYLRGETWAGDLHRIERPRVPPTPEDLAAAAGLASAALRRWAFSSSCGIIGGAGRRERTCVRYAGWAADRQDAGNEIGNGRRKLAASRLRRRLDHAASAGGDRHRPLRPSNSGFLVDWSELFRERFAGQPLKSEELAFGGVRLRGEAMITRQGIEGGAIYALSPDLRATTAAAGEALLYVDLRPDIGSPELERRLAGPREKRSVANWLRKQAELADGPQPVARAQARVDRYSATVRLDADCLRPIASTRGRRPVATSSRSPVSLRPSSSSSVYPAPSRRAAVACTPSAISMPSRRRTSPSASPSGRGSRGSTCLAPSTSVASPPSRRTACAISTPPARPRARVVDGGRPSCRSLRGCVQMPSRSRRPGTGGMIGSEPVAMTTCSAV